MWRVCAAMSWEYLAEVEEGRKKSAITGILARARLGVSIAVLILKTYIITP
jgi:hypothetical protein